MVEVSQNFLVQAAISVVQKGRADCDSSRGREALVSEEQEQT